MGAGEAVNVEYVSANPTGPLHVGHCRGAVFGDALASLLEKAGFRVTREYYINDAGAQVDDLARSAHLRYREALGEAIGDIPEGLYPGGYLVSVGQELAERDGEKWRDAPESEWLAPVRAFAIDAMMALIRDDLAALGIHQEVFTSERGLQDGGKIERALDNLTSRSLIYTGVLEPPKGMKPEDWEPREQTLFKATEFGDDVDRPIRKSDRSWTYFAGDLANHLDKYERGFNDMINVWGADHGGYVKRMKAGVAALSGREAKLDIKLCQMVNLLDDGKPVKMSKRAGNFVTLRDVVDQVGKDVVRFIMLTRKNDAQLDFDFARVTEQSRENPVFYVQYAHARARSVFRNVARDMPDLNIDAEALPDAPLDRLSSPDELALIKALANWPRIVESAAEAHEPHRVAFYLHDLASEFHGFWNKGNDDPNLRFIRADDADLTRARLALVEGVATVIASGLGIMGVEPVDEMR
jgi:arginyl-tRNA synthetase